ncbi:MAG: response regulator transcription factor [Butyrivibrio sp.]|nr:response regulator transcription factor [Acetatifactor muris]MCM1561180.1 response regulator transcription factor [Butyrivibrio sp.]
MYHVLIADDESIIREGIKCLLDWESLGYTITDEAAGGEQALQKLLSQAPDVALMDIRMPGLTGLEVIRRAREAGYDGEFIILSGYSDFKYAQEAMRCGVQYYLTKPVDEEDLSGILGCIRDKLDSRQDSADAAAHYRQKARDAIVRDILLGKVPLSDKKFSDLHGDVYQVVICQPYNTTPPKTQSPAFRFADLLHLANQDNNFFDSVTLEYNDVFLLKGSYAVGKFAALLEQYGGETTPQKDSPLDAFFITYGKCVHSAEEIPQSYYQASKLLERRFFCGQAQHTIGYRTLPDRQDGASVINARLLADYSEALLNYIQAFNRSMAAETLNRLQQELCNASDSIDDIKLFLADLCLSIKEKMSRLYGSVALSFAGNADIIRFINSRYYLYEIILFLTEQFEAMMAAIGNSSRDSVLDDILRYINHNYADNITLENIATLFGYNSSYLGRIFSKKMGENFNSYVDHVRIEHSKELLLKEDAKVYTIAEKVGYRSPDYFHTKFKKYVGMSPAEYRKRSRS